MTIIELIRAVTGKTEHIKFTNPIKDFVNIMRNNGTDQILQEETEEEKFINESIDSNSPPSMPSKNSENLQEDPNKETIIISCLLLPLPKIK